MGGGVEKSEFGGGGVRGVKSRLCLIHSGDGFPALAPLVATHEAGISQPL